jgi:biopolymer transport protein ExbB
MNKVLAGFFTSCLLIGAFTLTGVTQDTSDSPPSDDTTTMQTDTTDQAAADTGETAEQEEKATMASDKGDKKKEKEVEKTFHQVIKEKFIEGGWQFMGIVLICLIIGLAFAIERIIMLNLKTVNANKLLNNVDKALESGGVEEAKEVCRSTRGPIASVLFQGLDRAKEGIDVVEKSIVSAGSVEMGKMERGLVWISLFIAIAPMLGFMGTVIGMIDAFDAIESAGDINPSLVAGGIKTALLTTLSGLIVAVILQVFYNYIVSKIDGLVNSMEDSSITLVGVLGKLVTAEK